MGDASRLSYKTSHVALNESGIKHVFRSPSMTVNPARGSRGKCCQILSGKLLSLPGKQTAEQIVICQAGGRRPVSIFRMNVVFMASILFFLNGLETATEGNTK